VNSAFSVVILPTTPGPTYRDAYVAAIEAVIAGDCYEENVDILAEYRCEIEQANAGR